MSKVEDKEVVQCKKDGKSGKGGKGGKGVCGGCGGKEKCKDHGGDDSCKGTCKDNCKNGDCESAGGEKEHCKSSVCQMGADHEADYTQPGSREVCMSCSHVIGCMVRELTGMGPDLRHLGLPRKRPTVLTSWKVKEIYMLREDGLTHRQIGAELEISASYVCKVLAHKDLKKALSELCA